jgi:hypothetical protein
MGTPVQLIFEPYWRPLIDFTPVLVGPVICMVIRGWLSPRKASVDLMYSCLWYRTVDSTYLKARLLSYTRHLPPEKEMQRRPDVIKPCHRVDLSARLGAATRHGKIRHRGTNSKSGSS